MGNTEIIKWWRTGHERWNRVKHSEFKRDDQRTNLYKFGFPNKQNVEPRYQQVTLNPEEEKTNYNKFFRQMQKTKVFGFIRMLGFI
jgi:hypothetical protein